MSSYHVRRASQPTFETGFRPLRPNFENASNRRCLHGDESFMFLSAIPLERVSEADLQRLITDAVRESRDLDFKRDAVGDDRDAKREFLRDVTSFANTAGGYLIIGMEESAGVADALIGLTVRPPDDEKLRLENVIRDGVEPRLVGVRIREVILSGGDYALVIKIPVSWNPPHRVAFGGTNRFYARNSAGAYELSVEQLRSAFLGGAELERRLEDFRFTRLARLETGHGGVGIAGKGRLVVQAVPLANQEKPFDLSVAERQLGKFLPPQTKSGINYRYNLDGFLLHGTTADGDPPASYTQLFRNGCVEIAGGGYLWSKKIGENQPLFCAGQSLNIDLMDSIETAIAGSFLLGATPPVAVMVSFLDGAGSVLSLDEGQVSLHDKILDRNTLLFEPLVIQDGQMQQGWQNVLRPVFDSLWNAFGYPRCHFLFDHAGNWTGVPPRWR